MLDAEKNDTDSVEALYALDDEDSAIKPEVLSLISKDDAIRYQLLPLQVINKRLHIATCHADNLKNAAKFVKLLGPLQFHVVSVGWIRKALTKYYEFDGTLDISGKRMLEIDQGVAEDAPTVEESVSALSQFVENMLRSAVGMKASDIHIAPSRRASRVLFRINGKLINMSEDHRIRQVNHLKVINRIKNMCMPQIDVSQSMVPQDGAFEYVVRGEQIDCRVNIMPDIKGQKAALRLHYSNSPLKSLENIGLPESDLYMLSQLLEVPAGMFLVTGPTGSGKTTTLYGCLQSYDSDVDNVITIEDPVEVKVEGFTQVQLRRADNEKVDLTFDKVLRAVLRQDPDIILVGEIRDSETAKVAIEASQTGHRVFSTLHTKSSIATVGRLKSMNVDQFGLLTEMVVVISQRLVGVNCPHCIRKDSLSERARKILTETEIKFLEGGNLKRSSGCEKCYYTGISGRTVVAEFLVFDDEVRDFMHKERGVAETKKFLREQKAFRSMWEKGLQLVYDGKVSLKELAATISADARD